MLLNSSNKESPQDSGIYRVAIGAILMVLQFTLHVLAHIAASEISELLGL
jgi:hypothetical protein